MKKIIYIQLFLFLLSGCALNSGSESRVNVVINGGRAITRDDFSKFKLTVSGSGMSSIIAETTGNSIEVTVPVGSNRVFKLDGYLINGIIISGSKESDVNGSNITISINLSDYDLTSLSLNNIDPNGNFGVLTSLNSALGGSEFLSLGTDFTLVANPGDDVLYHQWLSGTDVKSVEASNSESIKVKDFIQEGGTHYLTFRAYYKDRIVEESVAFLLVPTLLGSSAITTLPGSVNSTEISDIYVNDDETRLYVLYLSATGYLEFDVYDLSSPTVPKIDSYSSMNSTNSHTKITGFKYHDGREFVVVLYDAGNGDVSFEVFDTTNTITQAGINSTASSPIFGNPSNIEIVGDRIMVSNNLGTYEYTIVEDTMSTPSNPPYYNIDFPFFGNYEPTASSVGNKKFLYLGETNEPQFIYSTGPQLKALHSSLGYVDMQPAGMYNEVIDMIYDGRYLYAVGQVGDGDVDYEFQIFDTLETDSEKSLVGYSSLGRDINNSGSYKGIDLTKDNRYAVIADHTSGLKVFNVERPAKPIEVLSMPISLGTNDVIVGDKNLYISSFTDKKVYVISHNF